MYLKRRNATEETVETEVQRFREERRKNMKQEDTEVRAVMSRVHASRPAAGSRDDEDGDSDEVKREDYDDGDDNDSRSIPFASPARGQSRGSRRPSRGRGDSSRRGGRGRGGRGRASSSSAEEPLPSTSRGRNTTRTIKDAFPVVQSSKRSNINSSAVYV